MSKVNILTQLRQFLGMESDADEQAVSDRLADEMESQGATATEELAETAADEATEEETTDDSSTEEVAQLRTEVSALRADLAAVNKRLDDFEAMDAADQTQGKKEAKTKPPVYMNRPLYDRM